MQGESLVEATFQGRPLANCPVCATWFTREPKGKPKVYCSRKCQAQLSCGTASGYTNYGCRCRPCKDAVASYMRSYKADNSEAIRGKDRARRQKWRTDNPEEAKVERQRWGRSESGKDHNRRAKNRRRGARAGDPYKRMDVFNRDEGICHLCKETVAWEEFSLDHLIPISKGGPDCFENVATAHLECNVKRGNRPLTELFQ